MKILILGAGKMGSFFCDVLSFNHEVAIFDTDIQKLRFTFNTQRFTTYEEIRDFARTAHQCRDGEIHHRRFQKGAPLPAGEMHYFRHCFGEKRFARILCRM